MNKCHSNINWVNDTTPAINDTNLNYMDGCIDTIDDRVISLDTTKANESDMLLAFKDVSLNSTTGVITFTLFNNTTKTIDTLLEKVAINFDYDDDPTSPHYQNLIIELEDGTYKYIDMSALITEYEFTDSSTIDFTVTSGAVSASVIDGSITAAKLQPNYLADVTAQAQAASAAATAASGSASDAADSAEDSEAWAVGQRGGVDVPSTDPTYHNNAKYWKDQAQAITNVSFAGLTDTNISNPQNGQVPAYNATTQKWENKALTGENVFLIHFYGTGEGNVDKTVAEVEEAYQAGKQLVLYTDKFLQEGVTYLPFVSRETEQDTYCLFTFAASTSSNTIADVTLEYDVTAQTPSWSGFYHGSQSFRNSSATTPVMAGGTGRNTLTSNAVLTGNGTSQVNQVATASGAFYATDANGAPQFGTLPVAQGGTGAAALTSGEALIGNGTSAVGTRAITNNTSKSTAPSGSTNLATMNSLLYGMQNYNNRASAVNSADTNYTTAMARAIYATTTDLTAGTTALTNGTIALVYEA